MFNSAQHCCIALNITSFHIPSVLCADWVSSYCLVIKHSKSWGRKFRESHFNHYNSSFNQLLVWQGVIACYVKHLYVSLEVRQWVSVRTNTGLTSPGGMRLEKTESGQPHHYYAPAPFGLCVKRLSCSFQSGTNPPLQSAACRPLLLIQSCTVS